uniref:Uncharacterized protein n=1 Tax=Globodera rostochiensis TaxID=31243 RepID=A0A914GVA2_GLORO
MHQMICFIVLLAIVGIEGQLLESVEPKKDDSTTGTGGLLENVDPNKDEKKWDDKRAREYIEKQWEKIKEMSRIKHMKLPKVFVEVLDVGRCRKAVKDFFPVWRANYSCTNDKMLPRRLCPRQISAYIKKCDITFGGYHGRMCSPKRQGFVEVLDVGNAKRRWVEEAFGPCAHRNVVPSTMTSNAAPQTAIASIELKNVQQPQKNDFIVEVLVVAKCRKTVKKHCSCGWAKCIRREGYSCTNELTKCCPVLYLLLLRLVHRYIRAEHC